MTHIDPLEEEFRELEAEVHRRHCRHLEWIDVSTHKDHARGEQRLICSACDEQKLVRRQVE